MSDKDKEKTGKYKLEIQQVRTLVSSILWPVARKTHFRILVWVARFWSPINQEPPFLLQRIGYMARDVDSIPNEL
jgi:hypothetical protein